MYRYFGVYFGKNGSGKAEVRVEGRLMQGMKMGVVVSWEKFKKHWENCLVLRIKVYVMFWISHYVSILCVEVA